MNILRAFTAFIVWGLLVPTILAGFFSRLCWTGFRDGMGIFDHMMATVRDASSDEDTP